MRTGMNSVRVSEFSLQRLLQILAGVLLAIVATAPAIAAEAALLEHLEVSRSTDDLPAMRKRRQIRALVTYSRTDFVIKPDGKAHRPAGRTAQPVREAAEQGYQARREEDPRSYSSRPPSHDCCPISPKAKAISPPHS